MLADYNAQIDKMLETIEQAPDAMTVENSHMLRKKLKHVPDDKIIDYIGMADMSKIIYILSLKYGQAPQLIPIENDLMIRVGKCNAANMSYLAVYLHFLKFENKVLMLEGNVSYPTAIGKCDFGITVNGASGIIGTMTDMNLDLKLGKSTYETRTAFCAEIDLADDTEIIFFNRCNGMDISYGRINSMRFAPVADCILNQYFWKDGFAFYIDGSKLICKKSDKADLIIREERFRQSIKKYAPDKFEWASGLRDYFYKKTEEKKKPIWLLMDRTDSADDSARVLFKYIQSKPDIDSYFVISEESKDYKELCSIGKTIALYSEEHYRLALTADYVISSQCNGVVENPFWGDAELFRDLYHRPKIIFLQHGVIKDDMSLTLNRFNTNFTGFVTSTRAEWKSILDYPYFYTQKEVWLTGLPRYDELINKRENTILIMPSWRQGLMEQQWDEDKHNMQWILKRDFENSEFFKRYSAILNNANLQSLCEKHGYTVAFMAHPLMKPYVDKLAVNSKCEIWDDSVSYREAFAKGALMVTDYSSVAFDFLYLGKPVVYYQFDKEQFFREHTYKPGYFSYDTTGLGPVCEEEDDLVRVIAEYIERDCEVDSLHKENIANLWEYHGGFSERVYKKIVEDQEGV